MLSKGNSDAQVCVTNLISTYKKEAFYGREKGIPTNTEDMPFSTAADQIAVDAEDMINDFEERVEVNEITVSDDGEGGIYLNADIDIIGESLDEDEEEDDE